MAPECYDLASTRFAELAVDHVEAMTGNSGHGGKLDPRGEVRQMRSDRQKETVGLARWHRIRGSGAR
jgi:hypothetical protein